VSDAKAVRLEFCSELKRKIQTRFPTKSCNVVNAFDIMGLRPLSFLSEEEAEQFGNDKLETLIDHYGTSKDCKGEKKKALINAEETKLEWQLVKQVVRQQRYPRHNTAELWKIILDFHKDTFPNLLVLANIALMLPLQTADVERAFSCQNLIKSSQRNRLSPESVNKLMLVNLEGPEIEKFNFGEAAAHWKAVKQRNIFK
jgi:hypothetical protein